MIALERLASLLGGVGVDVWIGNRIHQRRTVRARIMVEEYERTRLTIDDSATREETLEYAGLCPRMHQLEGVVIATPATSRDGVIAKLFMIARVNGDGASPDDEHVARTVEEAQSLLGLQSRKG